MKNVALIYHKKDTLNSMRSETEKAVLSCSCLTSAGNKPTGQLKFFFAAQQMTGKALHFVLG